MNTITANTIRFYLHNIDQLKDEIIEIEESLRQYRLMEIDCFTVSLIKVGQKTNKTESPVEKVTLKRLDRIIQMENELFYLRTVLEAINTVINRLQETHWNILKARYFANSCSTWRQIAGKFGYEEITVKKIDARIINAILKVFIKKIGRV